MSRMEEQERNIQVELASRGDHDALQRLIVCYHAPLRVKIASSIDAALSRRIDADDVLQQAYISAFKALTNHRRDYPGESCPEMPADESAARPSSGTASTTMRFDGPGGFYKWLERIVLNELKNQQRAAGQQKRDIRREVCAPANSRASYPDLIERVAATESTPSRRLACEEAIAAVLSSLARLSDDQRDVVRLRFLEGQTVPTVAERLGKTEAAVHAACYRGLKALRESMTSITSFLTRL